MALFFTGDTHWGDHRTLNIGKRAFVSVAEMDAALIERWNRTVQPNDVIWHLGDVARWGGRGVALLAVLNGTKHLIRGNNDSDETRVAPGWASVGNDAELEADRRRLVLCHYPFRTWTGRDATRSTCMNTAMADWRRSRVRSMSV